MAPAVRRPDLVLFAYTCGHAAGEPVAAESACASHRPTRAVRSRRHSFGRWTVWSSLLAGHSIERQLLNPTSGWLSECPAMIGGAASVAALVETKHSHRAMVCFGELAKLEISI